MNAITRYTKAANAGDTNATTNLGVLCTTRTRPTSPVARNWWQKAADAGDTSAMTNLGVLLRTRTRRTWPVPATGGKAVDAGHTGALDALRVFEDIEASQGERP